MILRLTPTSAEKEGFEPPVRLPVHRISSAAHSTTLTFFRKKTIEKKRLRPQRYKKNINFELKIE